MYELENQLSYHVQTNIINASSQKYYFSSTALGNCEHVLENRTSKEIQASKTLSGEKLQVAM